MKSLRRRFANLGLAQKLILINVVFIVLPLGFMGFLAFSRFSEATENKVGEYQLQTLKQLTLNIDTYMNELNRLTVMPYQYPKVTEYLQSSRAPSQPLTLDEIHELNGFVTQVFLNGRVDILGVSLYGTKGASYVVLPESQYVTTYKLEDHIPWLDRFQGHFGEPVFVATHDLHSVGGNVYQAFSIARELRSFNSGRTIGYIVIDVNTKFLEEIIAKVSLNEEESLFIADKQGQLVIGRNKDGGGLDPSVYLGWSGKETGHAETKGGTLVAQVTSDITGWTTVGLVPAKSLMRDTYTLRTYIVVIGIVCVAVALFSYVFIAYRITQPLRKLSRLMRNVGRGEIQAKFPQSGRDEVGQLGLAFNRMVDKLSEIGYLLYETELREKDAQIAALQSKINPHFLYNTLGSISMYAEMEGSREIVTMANNLSKLLRYSLSGRRETVTLGDELEHVRGYMAIQSMRYGDRIRFEMTVDSALRDCRALPLLVQPLVENAINHALDKGAGEGRITLTASADGQTLRIAVEDDGIGMNASELQSLRRRLLDKAELGGRSGNGLLNVHRRIVLHYGEEYGLGIESMPFQGFKAILSLPEIHTGDRKEEREIG
ncbi:sensor histidine kinase [Paenibacillus spiritus]|uniref:Sensor histidine kinase n=1 Tax=Paenibacillus spiritus TaxID=2496557 RepID=A0A5J5G8A6_9BACL|nr:sensor histidine kinase [Paenibacillus spiritus]KAA9003978.1 sensor histidine kinase [Paenibacillus spiritus]